MAELNITYEDGAEFFTTTYRGSTVSATLAFLTCGKNIVELINKELVMNSPIEPGKWVGLNMNQPSAEAVQETIKENLKAVELGKNGLDMGTPAPITTPSLVSIKPDFDWSDKYDSRQVAEYLGVSQPYLSKMRRDGSCPEPDGKNGLAFWWYKTPFDAFVQKQNAPAGAVYPVTEEKQVDIEDAIAEQDVEDNEDAEDIIEEVVAEKETKPEVFDNFQDIRARLKQGLGRGDE